MYEEYEVEIDGVLFNVRQISALDRLLAERDSEELEAELGSKDAELIARACILSKSLYKDEKPAFQNGYEVLKELTSEKVYELTHTQAVYEKKTERVVERNTDISKNTTEGNNEYTEFNENIRQEYEYRSYRSRIEELSRYLERDSRRFDGYFEMY